jgi:hypothetical protein
MFEVSVKLKEGLGKWFGGLGRTFAGKSREAKREIEAVDRPEQAPRTSAEQALWQAMGWDQDDTESGAEVAASKAVEALR